MHYCLPFGQLVKNQTMSVQLSYVTVFVPLTSSLCSHVLIYVIHSRLSCISEMAKSCGWGIVCEQSCQGKSVHIRFDTDVADTF